MKPTNSYPGGKAGPGVFQRLINEIPPHQVFVSAFAGRCALARYMRPAQRTILIDADAEPLKWWAEYSPGFELHQADAVEWLRYRFGLTRFGSRERAASFGDAVPVFVFMDPPYPMSTRSSGPLYRCEMSDADHGRLLAVALELPALVMITSYPNALYADALKGWRTFRYQAVARSGAKRIEQAWCNYDAPAVLHDASFIGRDKREREKLRRRIRRLSSKLARLPELQRQAVLDAVAESRSTAARNGGRTRSEKVGRPKPTETATPAAVDSLPLSTR